MRLALQRLREISPLWLILIALLTLAGSVIFALGPAHYDRSEYVFEGSREAGTTGAPIRMTLVAGYAETFTASLPCNTGDGHLSTSAQQGGIVVDLTSGHLILHINDQLAVEANAPAECQLGLAITPEEWSVALNGTQIARGELEIPAQVEMLDVSGSFRSDADSRITVVTVPHGSSPSLRQWVTGALAVALAGLVLLHSAPPSRGRAAETRSAISFGYADLVVIIGAAVWLILGPAFFDDGWIVARQRAYDYLGEFSNLFHDQAEEVPLGYWYEWLQQFWTSQFDSPLLLRLPSLGLIVLGWWMVRRVLVALHAEAARPIRVWVAAASYLVGSMAWLLTLRPEPLVALLATVALSAVLAFQARREGRWLVVSGLVVILSVTVHPAGVVVAAPLLASWSAIWDWLRDGSVRRSVLLAAYILAVLSLGVVLVFLDSDISSKAHAVSAYQAAGANSLGWFDEPKRYAYLGVVGTIARRASVGLMGLAVICYLSRGPRVWWQRTSLPGRSMILALVMLAFVPSKWVWHFGGLVGISAVALAIETSYLDGTGGKRAMRPAGIALLGAVILSWAWSTSFLWHDLDLRTLSWAAALDSLPVDLSEFGVWVMMMLAVVGCTALWQLRTRRRLRPLGVGFAVALILACALIGGFTAGTLAADAVMTRSWTFGRQNLNAALGRSDCGLAEQIIVPARSSLHALANSVGRPSPAADDHAMEAGFEHTASFTSSDFYPTDSNTVLPVPRMIVAGSRPSSLEESAADDALGSFRSAWYRIDEESDHAALMVLGYFQEGNAVAVQWGRISADTIDHVGIETPLLAESHPNWLFLPIGPIPAGAEVARVLIRDDTAGPEGWIASSQPLGYEVEPLAKTLRSEDAQNFVTPQLALYMPCAQPPSIDNGIVPPLDLVVLTGRELWSPVLRPAARLDRMFLVSGESPTFAHVIVYGSQDYLTGEPYQGP